MGRSFAGGLNTRFSTLALCLYNRHNMEWTFSQHWHLAWIIPAAFLAVYLGSPRHRGRMAYRRVKRVLEQSLNRRRFTQFHGLVLPTGGGSETLDHVVVSRHGIFVIVSEHRPGLLSGGESQELWKQVRFGRARRWPNPLYRAKLQMETLQGILGVPRDCFHLVVALGGQDKPPKGIPRQVLLIDRLVSFMESKADHLLTAEQADRMVAALRESRLGASKGVSGTSAARFALALAAVFGIWFVYADQLRDFLSSFDENVERMAAPERFDASGQRKSEQQLLEESLACAYSADTMRCACYGQGGEKADVEFERCRELAERGSVLKQ